MKRIFTLIISLLLAFSSFSQKIRFTDSTNRWGILWQGGWPPLVVSSYEAYYGSDTAVNGNTYRKLFARGNTYLVREDTMLKKVYCRAAAYQPNWIMDTAETVLYDYNLVAGDSVTRLTDGITWRHGVASIDSCTINSAWHRIWKFSGRVVSGSSTTSLAGSYTVIEGLGCVYSSRAPAMFMPCYPVAVFESDEQTKCFTNQYGQPPIAGAPSINIFLNGSYPFDNASSCKLSIRNDASETEAINIYPNPANVSTQMKFTRPITGHLTICNTLGQTVYKKEINKQDRIPIGKCISVTGTYFYHLTSGKGQHYNGKFVFEQ